MHRRGFTLIEVTVVVTILVVVAALVAPNFVNMQASRDVRSFVNALPDLPVRARDVAVTQGVTTKLTYDDTERALIVSIERAEEDEDEVLTRLSVPTQVEVQTFKADGEQRSAGDWELRFYSDGRSDGGGIETNDAGLLRSLFIDRDGVAQLLRESLPELEEDRWPAGVHEQRA